MSSSAGSRWGGWNVSVGLLAMVLFMLYGFLLVYMRDFSPDREAWIAASNLSPHFESTMAHVHGNLFSLLNVIFGLLLMRLPVRENRARAVSLLAIFGLLMPVGILSEVYLGLPPYPVLLGAASMVAATLLLGLEAVRAQKLT